MLSKVVTGNGLYSSYMHSKTEYGNDYFYIKTAPTLTMIYYIFLSLHFAKNLTLLEYPLDFTEMPWLSLRLNNNQYLTHPLTTSTPPPSLYIYKTSLPIDWLKTLLLNIRPLNNFPRYDNIN